MVLLDGQLEGGSEELPETLIFIAGENSREGRVMHYVCLLCDELVAVETGQGGRHDCAGDAAKAEPG